MYLKHQDYISYNYYGTKRTYKEFAQEIDRCAEAFKSLGVKYKDRVSICMPNTPEAIISFYALNKIGAVANMIHPLPLLINSDTLSFQTVISFLLNLYNGWKA